MIVLNCYHLSCPTPLCTSFRIKYHVCLLLPCVKTTGLNYSRYRHLPLQYAPGRFLHESGYNNWQAVNPADIFLHFSPVLQYALLPVADTFLKLYCNIFTYFITAPADSRSDNRFDICRIGIVFSYEGLNCYLCDISHRSSPARMGQSDTLIAAVRKKEEYSRHTK